MPDRPRTYKTEGIILRRRNIGEADTIFTVFSRREGKFDAVARGVRKARSHMGGHLEPLSCARMMLARGRSLDVFTQAETIAAFRGLREDLSRGAAALYCAELIDRFTVEHAENPGLYELLLAVLDAIDTDASVHIVRYFEIRLLSITGFDLRLDACAICDLRLPEEDTLLAGSAGGLVCRECRSAAGGGRIISPRAIKVLRYARSARFEDFLALKLDEELGHQLQLAMADVIRYVLEREPATVRYVEQIDRLPGASVVLPPPRVH